MKKGIIILERKNTIKSIKLIDLIFRNELAIKINAKSLSLFENRFAFSECTNDTKTIIIDGIEYISDLEKLYNLITHGVCVNKKYKEAFYINPKVIVICTTSIKKADLPKGASFTNRFDIL